MTVNSSISGMSVVFKKIVKKHTSDTTKRIHYKVLAALKTDAGSQRQAYWFSADRPFLRQRDETTGKTSLKVGCTAQQRARIRKLVKTYNNPV
ncbi:MAG TPA: hypothetical protein VGP72_07695 [Planctomycetota bacterium]|jgi:ribosomal protein L44E